MAHCTVLGDTESGRMAAEVAASLHNDARTRAQRDLICGKLGGVAPVYRIGYRSVVHRLIRTVFGGEVGCMVLDEF